MSNNFQNQSVSEKGNHIQLQNQETLSANGLQFEINSQTTAAQQIIIDQVPSPIEEGQSGCLLGYIFIVNLLFAEVVWYIYLIFSTGDIGLVFFMLVMYTCYLGVIICLKEFTVHLQNIVGFEQFNDKLKLNKQKADSLFWFYERGWLYNSNYQMLTMDKCVDITKPIEDLSQYADFVFVTFKDETYCFDSEKSKQNFEKAFVGYSQKHRQSQQDQFQHYLKVNNPVKRICFTNSKHPSLYRNLFYVSVFTGLVFVFAIWMQLKNKRYTIKLRKQLTYSKLDVKV